MSNPASETVEDVAQALVGDVDPERLDSFRFAQGILPAFRLVRALFSQNETDTCLKLMLLYELSRTVGRFSIERIRVQVPFLDAERTDALARSLKDGGWLELRAADNTYTLSTQGLSLLETLHTANLASLSSENALARAAQNAAFSATLHGAEGRGTSFLLDRLLVSLEGEVENAHAALQHNRPYRMIEWSRRQHSKQLEIIRQVLGIIQEKLDESSREFGRIVRLHEAMQEIIRLHTGINTRLLEWNLERLYNTEKGYSIAELCEAIQGVDDLTLDKVVAQGLILARATPPSLTTNEIIARFHGARRRLSSQEEEYLYSAPAMTAAETLAPADRGPASALRARLTEVLSARLSASSTLELEEWVRGQDFATIAYDLATLVQLDGGQGCFRVDDGRIVKLTHRMDLAEEVPPESLLRHLVDRKVLRELPSGFFARVLIIASSQTEEAHDGPADGDR